MAKPTSKKYLIIGVFLCLLLIGAIIVFFSRKNQAETTILDEFPIWILEDNIAVYRELEVSSTKIKKTIIVDVPEEVGEKEVQIYEVIPKELAAKSSDLNYSVQPEIIEDDPVVLWNIGPGKRGKELSWWDSATLLPRVSIFVAQTLGRAVVGKLTGACDTQTAKDWMQSHAYGGKTAVDCAKYIEHINKEVQERESKEWQNKLKENKVLKSIESGDKEYEEIKSKIKKKPEETPSTNKISKEKVIEIVKKTFPKPLGDFSNIGWPPSICNPETAAYVASEQKWHIICKRGQLEVGDIAHAAVCESRYDFFTVDNDGQAEKVGWYSKCRLEKDGSVYIEGEPKWGIK